MTSRKRSNIWLHFDEAGPQKAKCKLCNAILSGQGGTTSNYKKHLQTKHPTALLMQVREEHSTETSGSGSASTAPPVSESNTRVQRTRQSQITSFVRTPIGSFRQSNVDEELVKMIALDLQPFSIVDDTGFRRFLKAVDPSYILPNRKNIS